MLLPPTLRMLPWPLLAAAATGSGGVEAAAKRCNLLLLLLLGELPRVRGLAALLLGRCPSTAVSA